MFLPFQVTPTRASGHSSSTVPSGKLVLAPRSDPTAVLIASSSRCEQNARPCTQRLVHLQTSEEPSPFRLWVLCLDGLGCATPRLQLHWARGRRRLSRPIACNAGENQSAFGKSWRREPGRLHSACRGLGLSVERGSYYHNDGTEAELLLNSLLTQKRNEHSAVIVSFLNILNFSG